MFINSTENIDKKEMYSEQLNEGLRSGIVFTEIGHNYVNPTSDLHKDAIKNLMKDKNYWATEEAQQNYSSEYAIFNEYMTHSLFCLFVQEKYPDEIQGELIERRIKLMERRGYPMFEQFNRYLLELMKGKSRTVYESYSVIIDKMKNIL